MTKMDKIWVALASLLHPHTESTFVVNPQDVVAEVRREWRTEITPIMLDTHLVSWKDRQADTSNRA